MAKVSLLLWKYQKKRDGKYPLRLRIYKNGKTHIKSTDYSLKSEEWDSLKGVVKPCHPNSKRLNHILAKLLADTLDSIITIESKTPAASIYKIKDVLNKTNEQHLFFEFAFDYLEKYNNPLQKNTYKGYLCKLKIFQKFVNGRDLTFDDITVTLLREFETYLRKIGQRTNTIGTNMKRIRLIYRAAVLEDVANANNNPFNQYRIKTERSKKTKLSRKEISRIRDLKLEPHSKIWTARNAFLLSYNLMGMRAGDITLLRWGQIIENRVEYGMRKTRVEKSIALTIEAKKILGYYNFESNKKYVFPFVEEKAKLGRSEISLIDAFTGMINTELKEIARLANIRKPLSMHIARHSWAQRAYENGLETRLIQKGLGHADINTTITYLADLTDTSLDSLNDEITS